MENNYSNNNMNEEVEEGINLKDFFMLCLSKWYWFVICVALTGLIAIVHILRTPATYQRSTELLIKDDKNGGGIGAMEDAFSDMGMFNTKSNVNNEVISLNSPALMYEVVKRLHLEMNYATDGRFHKKVLYGMSLPFQVEALEAGENTSFSFELRTLGDKKFKVEKFVTCEQGDKIKHDFKAEGNLLDTLSTPAGPIIVRPTLSYKDEAEKYYISRSAVQSAVGRYKRALTINREQKDASVIALTIQDGCIQRADEVLNTLIAIYNEKWVKDKNQIAISTSMFINERLAVIEKELGNVDDNISEFKSKHLITDVKSVSDIYMKQSAENSTQMLALNNQLYMARYIRSYLTDAVHKDQLLPANSGIESASIEGQISAYNKQLLERNALVANSSDRNPLVKDMDAALASMREAVMVSIDNQIETLNAQIKSLNESEAETTSKIASKPTESKFLISVERQQKVKESLYLFLLQKREENELSQAFTAYNSRIITPPTGSPYPIAPKKMMILLMAIVLGIAIPGGVLFVLEMTNTSVRGRKDLENVTVPFIGEIPMLLSGNAEKWGSLVQNIQKFKDFKQLQKFNWRRKSVEEEKAQIVVKAGSRNVINEAFRVLRTNLEFMVGANPKANVICVTSFNPGSGKSFLTMNTAVCLAIKNKKVLVIDGDMRHASASNYMGAPNVGLADYLSGRVSLQEVISRHPDYKSLYGIPVGTIPPNPTELLFEPRLAELIDNVRTQYDYIFIDCPPVEIVADTQIIEQLSDRTIFVVRAGVLEKAMLPELQKIYNEKRYKNMSLILNGTEIMSHGYRNGYRYGYHYGYGSGYHYGSDKEN